MPVSLDVVLYAISRYDLFLDCQKELLVYGGHMLSEAHFRAHLRVTWPFVKFREHKGVDSKCSPCWRFVMLGKILSTPDEREKLYELRKHHHLAVATSRQLLVSKRRAAELSTKTMFLMVDGMAQDVDNMPYFGNTVDDAEVMTQGIEGAYCSDCGTAERTRSFYRVAGDIITKGTNKTLTVVSHMISTNLARREAEGKPIPTELTLYVDGGEASVVMLQFLIWLVANRIFLFVEFCRLLVGHTHELLDQWFGIFKHTYRQANMLCPGDFKSNWVSLFKNGKTEFIDMFVSYDFVKWLESTDAKSSLPPVSNHHFEEDAILYWTFTAVPVSEAYPLGVKVEYCKFPFDKAEDSPRFPTIVEEVIKEEAAKKAREALAAKRADEKKADKAAKDAAAAQQTVLQAERVLAAAQVEYDRVLASSSDEELKERAKKILEREREVLAGLNRKKAFEERRNLAKSVKLAAAAAAAAASAAAAALAVSSAKLRKDEEKAKVAEKEATATIRAIELARDSLAAAQTEFDSAVASCQEKTLVDQCNSSLDRHRALLSELTRKQAFDQRRAIVKAGKIAAAAARAAPVAGGGGAAIAAGAGGAAAAVQESGLEEFQRAAAEIDREANHAFVEEIRQKNNVFGYPSRTELAETRTVGGMSRGFWKCRMIELPMVDDVPPLLNSLPIGNVGLAPWKAGPEAAHKFENVHAKHGNGSNKEVVEDWRKFALIYPQAPDRQSDGFVQADVEAYALSHPDQSLLASYLRDCTQTSEKGKTVAVAEPEPSAKAKEDVTIRGLGISKAPPTPSKDRQSGEAEIIINSNP
jgi:hypothetical protein